MTIDIPATTDSLLDPKHETTTIATLKSYIEKTCHTFAMKNRLLVSVSEAKVVDVVASARSTAEFHNIDQSNLSRYKEYAHIGFWLARHKPISIITPATKKRFKDNVFSLLKSGIKKKVSGFAVQFIDRIDRIDELTLKPYDEDAENYMAHGNLAINEHFGLLFIWDYCETVWDQQIRIVETSSGEKAEMFRHQVRALRDRYHSEVFDDLVWSLRYHNFTPRAFASCMEAILRLNIR